MPPPRERTSITVRAERAVLVAVRLPGSVYDHEDPFGELAELCWQAGGTPVGTLEQRREAPEAGTYMGRGKLDELRAMCDGLDASMVIFDHELSPKQISAIERITERKVLDRSELILDIFASRASTHEAKLQVELAQLEYTYPRLRAMWDHLERIVGSGGIGGVGTRGPGEQQLEIDRRLVQRRKMLLKAELEEIRARKRRGVRQRTEDHFTIGLVGYTNAGKSTLFNTMTAGGAYADDRLFATLMTRTREWDLGGGIRAMLSDTVGFVRDLPHHLVASFRATLEEATHADLLLIVLDVADRAADLQYQTVQDTLDAVFEEVRRVEAREEARAVRDGLAHRTWTPPERIVVLNKADRLADNAALLSWTARLDRDGVRSVPLCALAPDVPPDGARPVPRLGQAELTAMVREAARGPVDELRITVPLSDSRTVHTIENRGEVLERVYNNGTVTLRVRLGRRQLDQLRSAGARIRVDGEPVPADVGW